MRKGCIIDTRQNPKYAAESDLKSNYPAYIYLSKVKNGNTGKRREICSKLTLKTPERPGDIYLPKVNNRITRTRCEICSKLTIKTPERRHRHRSGVFNVNF